MTTKQATKSINKAIRIIKKKAGKNQFFCEIEEKEGAETLYISNGHLILTVPPMPGIDTAEIKKNFESFNLHRFTCKSYMEQIKQQDKIAARLTTFCIDIDRINKKQAQILRTAEKETISYILIDKDYCDLFDILGFSDIQAMKDKTEKAPIIGRDSIWEGFELMILPIYQARNVADVAADVFPIKFEAVV